LVTTGATSAVPGGSTSAVGSTSGAGAATTPAAGSFGYVVGGFGPDSGPGPTLHDREGTTAPGRYIPAVAAAGAVSKEKARARQRRRAQMRGYGDEFADMDSDLRPAVEHEEATTVASDRGAGPLGFAGTVRKEAVAQAAGLATLSGNGFGGGPRMPMVPGTWDPDAPEGEGEHS
jgi:PPE-repeat protein